uniref:Trefoil factor 1 n=1 Tax=Homo sapiens TaxID=9606 RepID=UPI0012E0C490
QTETCTVAPRERQNCGFPGVTPSQCANKGCCFDDTVRGVPWCFYPNTILEK